MSTSQHAEHPPMARPVKVSAAGGSNSAGLELLALLAIGFFSLLTLPNRTSAQNACGIEGRGGIWFSGQDITVADGSPVGDLDSSGLGLALGVGCDVSDRLLVGADVEADFGETLKQYRTLLTGAFRLAGNQARATSELAVAVRATAGWAYTATGSGDSVLLLPRDTVALEEDMSGPALGAGLRAVAGLTADLSAFFNAGWRASFFDLTRFDADGDEVGEEAETLHAFPITAGVRVRL